MRTAALTIAALLLLVGCSDGPDNTDPRKGRVTTDESNCLTGGCYHDWKVCVGSTLVVHVDYEDYRLKRSPECAA